jgi:GTP-binding protein YchF
MGFSCGIVGLPNVGKSTIFNALTSAHAQAENFPFCTIDPNIGAVKVPDSRLDSIAGLIPPEVVNPASMLFVDIAGLVKDASKGEGLGNHFLAHIRETSAIAHVVRCFTASDVVHVTGAVDPLRDVEIIDTELMLADLQTVTNRFNTLERAARSGADKEATAAFEAIAGIREFLEAGRPVRAMKLTEGQQDLLRELQLLTHKKVMYVANVDDASAAAPEANPRLAGLTEIAARDGAPVVPICGKIEAEIAQLAGEERKQFLKDFGMTEPGLHRLIRAGYELLGLQTFFTAGPKEAHAWTVHRGATAAEAAGTIHSDFEKGFVKAEVYHYDDLVKCGSEAAIRDAGSAIHSCAIFQCLPPPPLCPPNG